MCFLVQSALGQHCLGRAQYRYLSAQGQIADVFQQCFVGCEGAQDVFFLSSPASLLLSACFHLLSLPVEMTSKAHDNTNMYIVQIREYTKAALVPYHERGDGVAGLVA